MSRLVTEAVSRAEAEQRKGRAGRVAEGICYRMWAKAEEGALPAFPPAEIEAADLSGLALELAEWGAVPNDLAFLTPPPATTLNEAHLCWLNWGHWTAGAYGPWAKLARLPLTRLAHMLETAGQGGRRLPRL